MSLVNTTRAIFDKRFKKGGRTHNQEGTNIVRIARNGDIFGGIGKGHKGQYSNSGKDRSFERKEIGLI